MADDGGRLQRARAAGGLPRAIAEISGDGTGLGFVGGHWSERAANLQSGLEPVLFSGDQLRLVALEHVRAELGGADPLLPAGAPVLPQHACRRPLLWNRAIRLLCRRPQPRLGRERETGSRDIYLVSRGYFPA